MNKNFIKRIAASVIACVSIASMSAFTASASFCNYFDRDWSTTGGKYGPKTDTADKCTSSSVYVYPKCNNPVYVSLKGKCSNVDGGRAYDCSECNKYSETLTTSNVSIPAWSERLVRNYIMEIALQNGSAGGNVDAVATFTKVGPYGGSSGVWSPDTKNAYLYRTAN